MMIEKKDIKRQMFEADINGVELAARLGMSRQGLQAFLSKKHYTQEDLQRLADALGVVYVSEFRPRSR